MFAGLVTPPDPLAPVPLAVLLMVAVYISTPVKFAAFPSVLLLSTLFRLALAISSTRLIREEPSARGGSVYEISHDTLIKPILKSKEKRMEQERRKQELEQLRMVEQEREVERIKARRKSRIAIFTAFLGMVIALAMIALAGWAWQEKKDAQEATAYALKVKQESDIRVVPLAAPARIFGPDRRNSEGLPLEERHVREQLLARMSETLRTEFDVKPLLGGNPAVGAGDPRKIICPHDRRRTLGDVRFASPELVDRAIASSRAASRDWDRRGAMARAEILEKTAHLYQMNRAELIAVKRL